MFTYKKLLMELVAYNPSGFVEQLEAVLDQRAHDTIEAALLPAEEVVKRQLCATRDAARILESSGLDPKTVDFGSVALELEVEPVELR